VSYRDRFQERGILDRPMQRLRSIASGAAVLASRAWAAQGKRWLTGEGEIPGKSTWQAAGDTRINLAHQSRPTPALRA